MTWDAHPVLVQYWHIVRDAGQHCTSIGWTSCVCWVYRAWHKLWHCSAKPNSSNCSLPSEQLLLFVFAVKVRVTAGAHRYPVIRGYTVDLVIFACLIFREFLILGLRRNFADFGTLQEFREFSFFVSSAIIIIIFVGFLNSQICPPREFRKNSNLANIIISTVVGVYHRFWYMWSRKYDAKTSIA